MKLFSADMKMAEVIHQNYLLIPVINRFDIHLGFGEKNIRSLCSEKNIDTDFFVTILNTYSNENYFPEKKLKTFNIHAIINYLRETHKYYLFNLVPEIGLQIDALAETCKNECNKLELVKKFYLDYVRELQAHINREETITFPYIHSIYNMFHNGLDEKKYAQLSSGYSMDIYDKQHDNIDDKLYDLKSILIKYLNGTFDENRCINLVSSLFRLEKDIQDHTRIEDKILQPMVTEIELALNQQITSTRAKE